MTNAVWRIAEGFARWVPTMRTHAAFDDAPDDRGLLIVTGSTTRYATRAAGFTRPNDLHAFTRSASQVHTATPWLPRNIGQACCGEKEFTPG
jgi:hypothetical protein